MKSKRKLVFSITLHDDAAEWLRALDPKEHKSLSRGIARAQQLLARGDVLLMAQRHETAERQEYFDRVMVTYQDQHWPRVLPEAQRSDAEPPQEAQEPTERPSAPTGTPVVLEVPETDLERFERIRKDAELRGNAMRTGFADARRKAATERAELKARLARIDETVIARWVEENERRYQADEALVDFKGTAAPHIANEVYKIAQERYGWRKGEKPGRLAAQVSTSAADEVFDSPAVSSAALPAVSPSVSDSSPAVPAAEEANSAPVPDSEHSPSDGSSHLSHSSQPEEASAADSAVSTEDVSSSHDASVLSEDAATLPTNPIAEPDF